MISPKAFTVTSEHDWLIYDDFNEQIFQVLPGEGFHTTWGDRSVSGNIELSALDHRVIVFLRDKNIIRICDESGTTLKEFTAPKDLKIRRLFPLPDGTFGISSQTGVFIWKPDDASLRYLSDLKNPVYAGVQNNAYILIDQNGDVIRIP